MHESQSALWVEPLANQVLLFLKANALKVKPLKIVAAGVIVSSGEILGPAELFLRFHVTLAKKQQRHLSVNKQATAGLVMSDKATSKTPLEGLFHHLI